MNLYLLYESQVKNFPLEKLKISTWLSNGSFSSNGRQTMTFNIIFDKIVHYFLEFLLYV